MPKRSAFFHGLLGVVSTAYLARLSGQSIVLQADDPEIIRQRLPIEVPFDRLLETFSMVPAAIASKRAGEWLVTISDLNRHPFRAEIFLLLSALEATIARVLESKLGSTPWEWIKLVSPQRQPRIVGYWELAKREGVDIGPTAGSDLADLIHTARRSRLWSTLGYASGSDFDRGTQGLIDLRNGVVHAVRPIAVACTDVAAILATLRGAVKLYSRLADLYS